MGIFSRRREEPAPGQTAPVETVNETNKQPTQRGGLFSKFGNRQTKGNHEPYVLAYSRRPTFGQWLKCTWTDILTMVIMGVIGLGVYEAPPAPTRSFPIDFRDGEIVYPEFAYPLRKNIIPIYAAALMAALIPIFIILCMQIRVRSFWDVNNAIIGLLYSLITAAVFQVFLKALIGGLRPHFLAVCKPVIPAGTNTGTGYKQIMYTTAICTGDKDEINDSLESFPSGHSTAAFAGFIFLYLYLNAKLKVFANHHPSMWKLIAIYAPVLGATLIAGSLTIDEFHNWYDCVAGAIIGTVFAFSSYRMVYASVWDFRFNHIPLNRNVPFGYGVGEIEGGDAVFTRKVGWGIEGAGLGGAPFDASALGGMGMGGGLTGRHTQGGVTGGLGHNGVVGGHHGGGALGSNTHHGVPGTHAGHNGLGNGLGHNGVGHNAVPGARVAEPGIARRPVGDNIV
jgi:membrane-associated phospholipid phosphatase